MNPIIFRGDYHPAEKYSNESALLIGEEYGIKNPKSEFGVHVIDKEFKSGLYTTDIADLLRVQLGEKNIVVLFNGDTPI